MIRRSHWAETFLITEFRFFLFRLSLLCLFSPLFCQTFLFCFTDRSKLFLSSFPRRFPGFRSFFLLFDPPLLLQDLFGILFYHPQVGINGLPVSVRQKQLS